MTEEQIRDFIRSHRWTFAKSMPHIPHEYTLRKHARDQAEFERFVLHIRDAGEARPWGRYMHTYLDFDGHSYWTMGAPVVETILINREVIGANDAAGRRITTRQS